MIDFKGDRSAILACHGYCISVRNPIGGGLDRLVIGVARVNGLINRGVRGGCMGRGGGSISNYKEKSD